MTLSAQLFRRSTTTGLLAMAVAIALTGCKGLFSGKIFKERAPETPPPNEQVIDKSFFVDPSGKAKSFLCAWAPEVNRGSLGESEITTHYVRLPHCNVEFQITEQFLIAKTIHPSFPNDRSRWKEWVRIPIVKHFYYERQRDAYGRETNEWIENTQRSHWSARPKVTLNLAAIQFLSFGEESAPNISSVEDIEWDTERGFLGFSLNASMTVTDPFADPSALQARFRVNFLRFEHDPNFKKVPYHQENARVLNALHVMGRRIEGVEPELYAAHWDLRKTTKVYLNGVPKHLESTVLSSVEQWNKALQDIGAVPKDHRPFVAEVKNLKHPFDLRYPSITWIADRKLSMFAPLGIGMASADVRNGQILWGSVVMWGGALEQYINAYTSTEGPGVIEALQLAPIQMALNHAQSQYLSPQIPETRSIVGLENVRYDINATLRKEHSDRAQFFRQKGLEHALGNKLLTKETKTKKDNTLETRQKLMRKYDHQHTQLFVEEDLNLENLSGTWLSGKNRNSRTYPEMLESVVTHLAVHEFGHFLGLGHQFKENIVPKEGTVPSHFVKTLSEQATERAGFVNSTSVMGYRDGRVEMISKAEEVKVGPHDELVLRYLYRGQYSAYDREADEFVFADVPASGKIPRTSVIGRKTLPTAYFPSCNDYEASLGADPFCNRWDRGSRAEDIVKSYFSFISDNLAANLFSLASGGSDAQRAEMRLWYSSLNTFSRVRLFYDEMRRRMRSEKHLERLWHRLRTDKDALFEFSEACQKPDPTSATSVRSPTLREIFKDKEIVDLCRANAVVLNEMRFFMTLPNSDYSKIDHKNRYISGGFLEGDASRDWGSAFGTWYQLSNLPLKISSFYTLTAADPYMMYGSYMGPNFFYDSEENRFLYRTLYPFEYTRLIADAIRTNMRFGVDGTSTTTTLGRTVLVSGALLMDQAMNSNEDARLPREYNELLDKQTQFDYSMVAIVLEAVPPDSSANVKADHYKKFTGKIYDFFSGKHAVARDVFILPKGNTLIWANGMFLYPLGPLKFFDDKTAVVVAYKIGYDYQEGDNLIQDSVKTALMEKHAEIVKYCVNGFGAEGGLMKHFDSSSPDFEGFKIPPSIALEVGTEKMRLFYESIEKAFVIFDEKTQGSIPAHYPSRRMRTLCEESVRGVGQISAAAALLNGQWLSITRHYLEL